jgi:ATP-dependent Clp protease adaptor protein ClpS
LVDSTGTNPAAPVPVIGRAGVTRPVRGNFGRGLTHPAVACHHGRMTTPVEQERTQVEPAEAELGVVETPWQTVVWNDPVNLMSYVTYVLQKLFGYGRDKANKLMLDVHHKGKAIVSSGSKDKVEADVAKLHAAGLWATMQRSG